MINKSQQRHVSVFFIKPSSRCDPRETVLLFPLFNDAYNSWETQKTNNMTDIQ
jgi:hypothetical protein